MWTLAGCYPLHFTAGHAGLEFLSCARVKMIFSACLKNTNEITATVKIIWNYFNVHWHVLPVTPSTLTFGVSLMSRALQVPGALRQVCLEFHSRMLPEGRDLKVLVRWFSDTFFFFTHFTSHLKRPSIKGLQGTGMSKYSHHHRRLQVSGHISISAPQ